MINIILAICILIQNTGDSNIHPRHLKWCRKELRRIGVRPIFKRQCSAYHSTLAYFGGDDPWGYAIGRGTLATYGHELSKVWVYDYSYTNYLGEKVSLSNKEERKRRNGVLCHEIGHNLGLLHNDNPRSLMYAYYTIGSPPEKRQRFLRSDIRKIKKYMKSLEN